MPYSSALPLATAIRMGNGKMQGFTRVGEFAIRQAYLGHWWMFESATVAANALIKHWNKV
jgi:hypothetical protein